MPDKEKKRKRQAEADGPSKKKKKVTFQGQAGSVRVKHIARDKAWVPVVASTPGLSVPSVAFQTFRSVDASSTHKPDELLLHSREHPAMDYTAREDPAGAGTHLTKHYVAVYDPQTGELQVVEARKMSVRTSLRIEDEQLREKEKAKQESGLTLRQELGMTFGTKKAKKAISSLSENAITRDRARDASPGAAKRALKANPSARAVLESMATSASNAPTKDDLQSSIDDAKPRPKHNAQATKPDEVYEVRSIVGDELMKDLRVKPWVDAVEANEEVTTKSRYVSNRLRALCQDDEIVRLKVLRYMLLLLEFFNALKTVRGGGRKLPDKGELEKAMGVEKHVVDTIRKRFADGFELSKWHVDNLMTHLAALSLIVDEYQTDTYDLREDLGLKPLQISTYFAEIGARVGPPTAAELVRMKLTKAEGSMHRIARLKLPLEFPKQRKIPMAGKRR